jgi:enterochelin esterase-like enzyme
VTATHPPRIDSPRLAAFWKHSSGSPEPRFRRAWTAFASHGLPLVEPIAGDRQRLRVTFAWRPDARLSSASVYTPVANPFTGETQLRQLGERGLWYRSVNLPRRTRALYAFSPRAAPDPTEGGDWSPYFRSLVADPHNPTRLVMAPDPEDPQDVAEAVSVVALPDAPAQPWNRVRTPLRWVVDQARLRSHHVGGSRSIWVLTPPTFDPKRREYNLVVALDGLAYQSIVPAPRIVEYLVKKGKIGPSVLVLVGNAVAARDAELLHNPGFVQFLATELVPRLRRRYRLSVPAPRTVITGSSLGGLTAAYAALAYPKVFGNVLAQSGAFSWSKSGGTLGSPTLMDEYARAPLRSTKFYLDAGTLETTVFPGTHASILAGVRHLRDVLVAKGYDVKYAEFEGGHDYSCWSGTLADGLQHLLGGRKPGSKWAARS